MLSSEGAIASDVRPPAGGVNTVAKLAPPSVLREITACANVPHETSTYVLPSAMSKQPLMLEASMTCVHVPPLSAERHRPVRVAASTEVPFDSTLSWFTKLKSLLAVVAS